MLTDPQLIVDPALFDLGPVAYDEPKPTEMPTDPASGTEGVTVDKAADDQPLIETIGVIEDTPGRSKVPLPYERSSLETDPQAIGDPVDPKLEWCAFVGDAGSDTFPVFYMQMDVGNTGDAPPVAYPDAEIPGDVIYTLYDDSGLVFADMPGDSVPGDVIYTLYDDSGLVFADMPGDNVPGRSSNPLPYERSSSIVDTVPHPQVDPVFEWRWLTGEGGRDFFRSFWSGPVASTTSFSAADPQPIVDPVDPVSEWHWLAGEGGRDIFRSFWSGPVASGALISAPEPEIDRTPVHYSAWETFLTGLHLL